MSHTIWVDVRDWPKNQDEVEDCSIMLRLQTRLDGLCKSLKVSKLSDFFDYTELERAYADCSEESEPTSGTSPCVPQRGDEVWFDSGQALTAVQALLTHFGQNPNDLGFGPDDSRQHWPARLIAE